MSYAATPDRSMEDRRKTLGVCPQCSEQVSKCRASRCLKPDVNICGCERFSQIERELDIHEGCIVGHVTRIEEALRFQYPKSSRINDFGKVATEKGYRSRKNEVLREQNPYLASQTLMHANWWLGWDKADEEMKREKS